VDFIPASQTETVSFKINFMNETSEKFHFGFTTKLSAVRLNLATVDRKIFHEPNYPNIPKNAEVKFLNSLKTEYKYDISTHKNHQ
jgi:hypothetical protein